MSSSEPLGKTQNALTSMDDTGMTTIQLAHLSNAFAMRRTVYKSGTADSKFM